jgi:hypothetical protein
MPVIVTINFQIMGRGNVELGGAGAGAGTISGPYWNTIQIVDPSSSTVEFSTGVPQPAGWDLVMWGGQLVPGVLGLATLPISMDVSGSYLAVAVFAEGPTTTPTLCLSQNCSIGAVTGAPPEPCHESVRVANKLRACCAAPPPAQPPAPPPSEQTITRTVCGPALTPVQRWLRQPTDQVVPGLILQTTTTADFAERQVVVSRWRTDASGGLLVYGLDICGQYLWRTDLLFPMDTSNTFFQDGAPVVSAVFDSATGMVFIAATVMTWSVDTETGNLFVILYEVNPATGNVLGSRIFDEGLNTALTVPPIGFATNRAGTLYYSTTTDTEVFVRSVAATSAFPPIGPAWGGLKNTANAPLLAKCFGLTVVDGVYLYMNLTSKQTIQGGTRILSPYDPLDNTIIVKLALAPSLSLVWSYQSPALNTAGESSFNSLVVAPRGSVRVLYGNHNVSSNAWAVGFARLTADGALLSQQNIPGFAPTDEVRSCVLYRTPTTGRLFFLVSQVEVPFPVSFGELTYAGDVIWFVQSADYNPAGQTSACVGATATDRFLWLAYLTRSPFPAQTMAGPTDTVAIQFALWECFNITERICNQCAVRRPSQDFRTVHHRRESDQILSNAVRCPLFYQNRDTGGLCPNQLKAVYEGGTSPYALHAPRLFHRISSIKEVCRPVRGVSGSELTARIRARTDNSNTTLRRHSEHFRTLPPPPPCRLLRTTPQPGVPIAPVTPCILGNQRVDFSSPTK